MLQVGSSRILVVEDDPLIQRMIQAVLKEEGYRIDFAGDGAAAQKQFQLHSYDLVLLDLGLPDVSGFDLVPVFSKVSCALIVLTARDTESDEVLSLELGADDYLRKPFDHQVLRARIRKALKRRQSQSDGAEISGDTVTIGPWQFDPGRQSLIDDKGEATTLTQTECDLLSILIQNAGATLSRDQLCEMALKREWQPGDRSIDVLINRLRKKLEEQPNDPKHIITVRPVGYRFDSSL
ncbi:response regulator transcription factor [Aestuariispira insulae]|nr:response regulator transcription factor [Aestuariispira insulae]